PIVARQEAPAEPKFNEIPCYFPENREFPGGKLALDYPHHQSSPSKPTTAAAFPETFRVQGDLRRIRASRTRAERRSSARFVALSAPFLQAAANWSALADFDA
ncbi:hypothetical protein, partial [Hoeflea sp.]|uniref:hypothetical protein n=1 Tax=Hoeflea sp. TaxID=1940281 RepID=UPI0025C33AD0